MSLDEYLDSAADASKVVSEGAKETLPDLKAQTPQADTSNGAAPQTGQAQENAPPAAPLSSASGYVPEVPDVPAYKPPPPESTKLEDPLAGYLENMRKNPYEYSKAPSLPELSPEKPKPVIKEPNFYDNLTKAVTPIAGGAYKALQGAGAGIAKVASGADALMMGASKANPASNALGKAAGWQSQPYESPEQAYEKNIPEDTKSDRTYQTGKALGEAGIYAATPGMEGAGLAPLAARSAEGALFGAADSAANQMTQKGHIDAGSLATDTAFSGALGAGAHLGLKGAGKLAKKLLPKKESASGDVLKGNVEENIGVKPEEPQGPYRIPNPEQKKGFDIMEGATMLKDFKQILKPKDFKKLNEIVTDLGTELAKLAHYKNELEVSAKNALKLATVPSQLNKIAVKEEKKLGSDQQARKGAKRYELYLKQQQETKGIQEKKLEELGKALGSAPKAARGNIQKEIHLVEEILRKLAHPEEIFNVGTDKHLRGYLRREDLYSPEESLPHLAKDFEGALKQTEELSKTVAALQKQYDSLREKYLDDFDRIEKLVQDKLGNKERLHVKFGLQNAFDQSKKTYGTIGLNFNAHIAHLNSIYDRQLKAFEKQLEAEENAIRSKFTYGTPIPKGFDAAGHLMKHGLMNPNADKLLLAATLGAQALDMPAQAESGKEEQNNQHNLGNAAIALTASILAAKHGPAIARQIIRDPHWVFWNYYANTRDLLAVADSMMQKAGADSMAWKLAAITGNALKAQILSTDKPSEIVDAIFHGADTSKLTPVGQILVGEVHAEYSDLRKTAKEYLSDWRDHYSNLSPNDQEHYKAVDSAVHFMAGMLGNVKHRSIIDQAFQTFSGNVIKNWFQFNPTQYIAGVMDLAIAGPLKMGPVATARGYMLYADATFRKLADNVHLGGFRSSGVTHMTQQSKVVGSEGMSAQVATLGSLSGYFKNNQPTMAKLGISTDKEFIQKTLSGNLDPYVITDAMMQVGADISETLGFDYLRMNKGPFSRSHLEPIIRFISQPERYARLMATAIGKGNYAGVVVSLAVLHQFGGQAVVPKSLQQLAWLWDPENAAKMQYFLNASSIGQRVLGDLSGKVDWDPLLYPIMGVTAPGLENAVQAIGDLPRIRNDMGEALNTIVNHPERLTGSKMKDINLAAQKATRNTINFLSMLLPAIGPVPLQALSAFQYNLPGFLHGEYEISVPHPGIGAAHPLKSGEVKKYPNASQDSLRAMVRMRPTYDTTNYKTSQQGKIMAREGLTAGGKKELNDMQKTSGIRGN